ncbi:OLC1v1031595C2 [Oldenlandia corymbosa var. corymbosa]|uniref:Glutamate receptor n=1 Tax=Oldenlandia corymbosa var. corymbosa TaxID=529605 RepID=A0AAV1CJ63_OLDCO|nr:OLC1v1031595C2 [Oldenlandia corymbosa var. corymbosa]
MQNLMYKFYFYVVAVCWFVVQPPFVANAEIAKKVDVGIIVDSDVLVEKISKTCMLMALEDFYATHNQTKFRLVPLIRDSKSDAIEAASAGIDLLKNVKVQVILGPQRSTQAHFVIDLGNKVKVPIVSPATSPSLSPKESPFFVRAAHCASFQAEAIADIVKAYGWRQVVIVYEDSVYGSGIVPFLTESLLNSSGATVPYRSAITVSATDDQILEELSKLMSMQTRVFVVHLLPVLASRLFINAERVGMMNSGYAWIITETLTTLIDHSVDPMVIDSMQGVLGLKAYFPGSDKVNNFTRRWRKRFKQDHPEVDVFELNVYGLWAYDSATALAIATERIDSVAIPGFKGGNVNGRSSHSDLDDIGSSEMGAALIGFLRNIRFDGLSGDFHILDGQLQPSAFQIVNIIGKGERTIGFWTKTYGISNKLKRDNDGSNEKLGIVIWPGESLTVPKGWEIPIKGKKLRVGVPVKNGLEEFTKVERDPTTHSVIATGFCIEVFKEVMNSLPYAVPYDFIPFENAGGDPAGDYNDLVYQIFLKKYDAVVGDVTILANRSEYVDFTLPYTESGVMTVVRIKDDEKSNAWIFLKPLTKDLWLTVGGFFVFIGIVVWVIEHRINKEFQGPPHKQVGIIFWFSFSTLVYAHREKVLSNLSRFVVIVWLFVVLVLTSSYTANLTSMLTVQQLQPAVTGLFDLISNGDYIGYQTGSFVTELLKSKNFDGSKFRNYSTYEQYDEALSKGGQKGGVDAIVDELPYIRPFVAQHCSKYTMVGPTFKTAGFGFAFPKGSPLVPDVSRAVLNVTEGDKMSGILQRWRMDDEKTCADQNNGVTASSDSLSLDSFRGLFLIAGLSSGLALAIYFLIFLHENKEILSSDDYSVIQKFFHLARTFNEDRTESKAESSSAQQALKKNEAETTEAGGESPQTGGRSSFYYHNNNNTDDQDEGQFSTATTQPTSPIHDNAITIEDDTAEHR